MTRVYKVASLLIVAGALAASLALYTQMPAKIPTHWNIEGKIDGYGAKEWAAFLMPAILSGLILLFWALPWLSPKNFELDSFRSTYWFIVLVICAAMAYIHGLTLWAALASAPIDITRALLAGLLVMFGLMGNVMGKIRRNFYVGIRTPWTLASERVWNDTHRLAARMFVVSSILGLIAIVPPIPIPVSIVSVIAAIMGSALFPVGYSLWLYKKLQREGSLEGTESPATK
jgi:uncharacterized membrane protein